MRAVTGRTCSDRKLRGIIWRNEESYVVATKRELAPKDKRSKLDLELFLIALIKREINTPYLLHASAGLSPGATIPVLKRLNAGGFVRRGRPGVRKRTEYKVTAKGSRHLNSTWPGMLESSVPTDMEAILRTASVAILCGAERNRVARYLQRAAQAKAPDSKKEKQRILPAIPEQDGLYGWMRLAHVKARQISEAQVLRRLASALVNRRGRF